MLVYKLVIKEFFFPFGIALFSILSILLLGRMVPLLEFFVRSGANFGDLLKTITLFFPLFLQFALPMSGLFGMLISFVRLTQSHEIIGIFAIGVRPHSIFLPVFIISFSLFIASLMISTRLVPHSKYSAKSFLKEIGESTLYRGVPEGRFVEISRNLILFANKNKDQGRKLKGIFIWDHKENSTPLMIYAKRGAILHGKDSRSIVLELKNGTMTRYGRDLETTDVISFDEYSLVVGFQETSHKKSRGEMTTAELVSHIERQDISSQKRLKYTSELVRRYTLPVGTLFLCLLAAPLGIFFGRSGLSTGIALGIATFFGYYLITTLTTNIYETAAVASAMVLVIPDALLIALTWWLWHLMVKKGPVTFV